MLSSGGVRIPAWSPTKRQTELFEEWKKTTIAHLVSSKKGIQPFKLPGCLEAELGEKIPLDKMGFEYRNINQFLYQMRDDIEIRDWNEKLYIFVKEWSVPEHLDHIRKMVLGQKGKDDKPLRHHGLGVQASELLRFRPRQPATPSSASRNGFRNRIVMPVRAPSGYSSQFRGRCGPPAPPRSSNISPRPVSKPTTSVSRPATGGSIQSIVSKAMTSTGANRAAPRRIPNLIGLIDDDWGFDDSPPTPRPSTSTSTVSQSSRRAPRVYAGMDSSSDESDGFEFYSGPKNSKPAPAPVVVNTVTAKTQEEKKTPSSTSAPLEPQPEKVVFSYTPSDVTDSASPTLPKAAPSQPKRTTWQTPGSKTFIQRMAEKRAAAAKAKEEQVDAPSSTLTEPIVKAKDPKIVEGLNPPSVAAVDPTPELPTASANPTETEEEAEIKLKAEAAMREARKMDIDMEIHYGYSIEPFPSPYPYQIEPVDKPPSISVFKSLIKFPPYLVDPPKTFRKYLKQRGQLEWYKKEIDSL